MKVKREWISSVLAIILIFIPMFSEEIRSFLISLDWKEIMFILGLIFGAFTLLSFTIRKLFKKEFEVKYNEFEVKYNELLKENKDLSLKNEKDRADFRVISNDLFIISKINHAIIRNNFIVPLKNEEVNELAETLYSYFEKEGITIPNWEYYLRGDQYKPILDALDDVSYKRKKESNK